MVNDKRGATLDVPCICRYRTISGEFVGRTSCVLCHGSGVVTKKACADCGGTGKVGAKCPSCKGLGYRDIDNSRDFV